MKVRPRPDRFETGGVRERTERRPAEGQGLTGFERTRPTCHPEEAEGQSLSRANAREGISLILASASCFTRRTCAKPAARSPRPLLMTQTRMPYLGRAPREETRLHSPPAQGVRDLSADLSQLRGRDGDHQRHPRPGHDQDDPRPHPQQGGYRLQGPAKHAELARNCIVTRSGRDGSCPGPGRGLPAVLPPRPPPGPEGDLEAPARVKRPCARSLGVHQTTGPGAIGVSPPSETGVHSTCGERK